MTESGNCPQGPFLLLSFTDRIPKAFVLPEWELYPLCASFMWAGTHMEAIQLQPGKRGQHARDTAQQCGGNC